MHILKIGLPYFGTQRMIITQGQVGDTDLTFMLQEVSVLEETLHMVTGVLKTHGDKLDRCVCSM